MFLWVIATTDFCSSYSSKSKEFTYPVKYINIKGTDWHWQDIEVLQSITFPFSVSVMLTDSLDLSEKSVQILDEMKSLRSSLNST